MARTQTRKETVEKWVDIIREWQMSGHDPYPPIRPLAEKIAQAIQETREEILGEVESGLKNGTVYGGEVQGNWCFDADSLEKFLNSLRNSDTKGMKECPHCHEMKTTVHERDDHYAQDVNNDPDARMTCCDECEEQNLMDI